MAHALRSLITRVSLPTAPAWHGRPAHVPNPRAGRPCHFLIRHGVAFAFAFALVLGAVARAESAAPEQTVRFTVFSTRPAAGLTYVARSRQAAAPVVLYPTARSPRYEYRGPMPLRLNDSASKTIVAEATIPPTLTDALLLLVPIQPAPTTGLRYQTYVLDDSAARQTPGTLAIINFSGLTLTGTLEGKGVTLAAGLNAPQPIGRSAPITLRTMVKNRSLQAYAGTVELGKNERALLLLLPPFYSGSAEVQSRLLLDAPTAGNRR